MTGLHPVLRALAGSWTGHGRGDYPTIETFEYVETITLEQPPDKPFLAYRQKTRDASDHRPLHTESGFLRPGDGDTIEFLVAQPTGIVEVYEGPASTEAGGLVVDLRAVSIGLAGTAKRVRSLRRRFHVDGDRLVYDLWMAHEDVAETHHLHAELTRTEAEP